VLDVASPTESTGVDVVSCNVLDAKQCIEALRGAQIVFHRAGLYGNVPSISQTRKFHDVNVVGTLNVLEACAANRVERVVLDSTAFVYGDEVISPVCESAVAKPVSVYGATKLAAEALVGIYDRNKGVAGVVLRFCRVRDVAKLDVITLLARRIRDGLVIDLVDDGCPSVEFVDVDDATDASILAATAPVRGIAVNIGSGTMMPVAEIAEALARELGKPLPQVRSVRATLQPPSAEYLFGPRDFLLDITRGADALGWHPQKSLTEMIRETAAMVAGEPPVS
jgi:nucleoside-diphosphate-sugar epimerase